METKFSIEFERDQLIKFWGNVVKKHQGSRAESAAPMRRLLSSKSTTDDVRKIHDSLGWAAKEPIRCAGAIYRTRAFMTIPPERRDASKPRGVERQDWPRNIHIEHTILASQLHNMWLGKPYRQAFPIAYFMSNGVTTAMHALEEAALPNTHGSNSCFTDGAEGKPFQRYRDAINDIYNVVDGRKVDPDTFTLTDHRHVLVALLAEVGAEEAWIDAIWQSAALSA